MEDGTIGMEIIEVGTVGMVQVLGLDGITGMDQDGDTMAVGTETIGDSVGTIGMVTIGVGTTIGTETTMLTLMEEEIQEFTIITVLADLQEIV